MPLALPALPERLRALWARRGVALVLALLIELLLVLLLLFALVAPVVQKPKPVEMKVFGVENGDDEAPAAAEKPKAEKRAQAAQGRKAAPAQQVQSEIVVPPPAENAPKDLPFIVMTRRDYASTDIARMRSPDAGDASLADSAAPGGRRAGDSAVAGGKGPHGETLYAASWYVEPSHAELVTYFGAHKESGVGLIACKTVPGYRVEDCQELGERPRASGFSRSARQAAWQFRVRPPRINGKYMVGSWVSIEIRWDVIHTDAPEDPPQDANGDVLHRSAGSRFNP